MMNHIKAANVLLEKRLVDCSKKCDFLLNKSHYTEITAEFRHLSRRQKQKKGRKRTIIPRFFRPNPPEASIVRA